MLPATIISSLAPALAPAIVPLAKELISGYTAAVAKREEEQTKRTAIAGETKCRVAAIEAAGESMLRQIEGSNAIELQQTKEVGSLLHQPEVISNPQVLSMVLDRVASMQDKQHAQELAVFDRIAGNHR